MRRKRWLTRCCRDGDRWLAFFAAKKDKKVNYELLQQISQGITIAHTSLADFEQLALRASSIDPGKKSG